MIRSARQKDFMKLGGLADVTTGRADRCGAAGR